jgi:putative spermidine/putrescine transport system substrate-binding protein
MESMSQPIARRSLASRVAGSLTVAAAVLAACSPAASTAPTASPDSSGRIAALVTAARSEGSLSVMALPHGWCDYGDILSGFTARYGIRINELLPNGRSRDELAAIIASKEGKGPDAPDVVDLGLAFGPQARTDGLIQPYKVSTWDSIPATARDADGYWYGDYYGVLSFEVNTQVVTRVPTDWQDLLSADYRNAVALAGDGTVPSQTAAAVLAATLANGGSLDNVQPGLDFFRQLNDAGNLVPTIARTLEVASGEAPIRLVWSYTALADRDSLNGNPPITVVVPKSGRIGGWYIQAISAYAPHPNAARLWMEYLYSDEGQNLLLKGYCSPIRYEDMVARGVVPGDLAARLPESKGTILPTLDQITAASALITAGWKTTVGVTIATPAP